MKRTREEKSVMEAEYNKASLRKTRIELAMMVAQQMSALMSKMKNMREQREYNNNNNINDEGKTNAKEIVAVVR